jgi:predicted HTH transcriptional regulator
MAGEVAVEMAVEMAGKASEKRIKKILELIKANPEITKPDLASIIGVSLRSIERTIQALQKKNVIKRVGSTKKGRWEGVE